MTRETTQEQHQELQATRGRAGVTGADRTPDELGEAELDRITGGGMSIGSRGSITTTAPTRPGTSSTNQTVQPEQSLQPQPVPR